MAFKVESSSTAFIPSLSSVTKTVHADAETKEASVLRKVKGEMVKMEVVITPLMTGRMSIHPSSC